MSKHHTVGYFQLGYQMVSWGRLEEAVECFEKAVAAGGDAPELWMALAGAYERVNDVVKGQAALDRLHAHPSALDNPEALLTWSRLARRAGEHEAGIGRLASRLRRGGLDPGYERALRFELGHHHDALDHVGEAFASFQAARSIQPEVFSYPEAMERRYVERCRQLGRFFSQNACPTFSSTEGYGGEPAFILGFPRSGTTLLGECLGRHPAIRLVQEKHGVVALKEVLKATREGYPAILSCLQHTHRAAAQAAYWSTMGIRRDVSEERLWLDNLVVDSLHAGALAMMFPQARFLQITRHPLDVCLSGFMQYTRSKNSLLALSSLERFANVHAEAAKLARVHAELLGDRLLQVRYETLVAAPEAGLRAILDFLGVPWHPAVLGVETCQRRYIATPSYQQVVKPIYSTSVNRWKKYHEYLAPLAPRFVYFAHEYDLPL